MRTGCCSNRSSACSPTRRPPAVGPRRRARRRAVGAVVAARGVGFPRRARARIVRRRRPDAGRRVHAASSPRAATRCRCRWRRRCWCARCSPARAAQRRPARLRSPRERVSATTARSSCPGTPYGRVADWVVAALDDGWRLLPVADAERLDTGVHASLRADLRWPAGWRERAGLGRHRVERSRRGDRGRAARRRDGAGAGAHGRVRRPARPVRPLDRQVPGDPAPARGDGRAGVRGAYRRRARLRRRRSAAASLARRGRQGPRRARPRPSSRRSRMPCTARSASPPSSISSSSPAASTSGAPTTAPSGTGTACSAGRCSMPTARRRSPSCTPACFPPPRSSDHEHLPAATSKPARSSR